ncbi:MAG: hypothetical protein K2G16_08290 [Lachnospiraceae bacterium]|nr:hypothetical protein [Lachnospiraceae bacterium]
MWNVNKKMVKTSALLLSVVVAAGAMGVNVHAANINNSADSEAKDRLADSVKNVWQPVGEEEGAIGETIYVIAGAGGDVEKVIVSDGEELTEEAQSEENKLPLSMEISYMLDGKEISAEELAGKSGHVVIRCTYIVNRYEMAEVQGGKEKIYVPFAVAAGTILDGAHFQNVTVSSGRVVDDGSRCIVAGIAFPGLAEDLKLEDGPADYVEIEADVMDFVFDGMYSIATNEIFSDINVDDVTALDDLREAMDEMTEAMEALMDGSAALYNGLAELYEKSGDLQKGISALQAGAAQLSEGSAALRDGVNSLRDGAVNLTNGLNTLSSKNDELVNGAAQVFNTLLGEANKQLAASGVNVPALTIDNYSQVLGGVTASLSPEAVGSQVYSAVYNAVAAEVKKNEAAIRAGVTQEVQKQVFAGVLQAVGLSEDQYNAIVAAGDAAAEEQKQAVAGIDSAVEAQMQSEQIKQTIEAAVAAQEKQLIEQNMQSPDIVNKITEETANAANRVNEGAGKIAALKAQLDSYNAFYQGLIAYTNGVVQAGNGAAQLSAGAEQLAAGAESLNEGAVTLREGMDTLAGGSAALIDGVSRLKKGAMELRDGLTTFNEEGISKLTEALDGNYEELLARMQAMTQVSRSYNSYTNENGVLDGTVKFIYKTSEIR